MKLSFSTNAFVRYTVFEALETISAIGFKGAELLADAPHLYAPSVTDEEVEELKGLLGRTGLHVANINANTAMGYYGRDFWEPLFEPSLANSDPSARKWRIEYSKKSIDIAHALGSQNISLTSGRAVPGTVPKDALNLLRHSLDEVVEYAEKRKVRVGIEYEPGLLVECCKELHILLEEMDSPFLGANLDLGHSHVLGEAVEDVIGLLSDRIFHVHIEDIVDRKHYHLIPGTGDMNFRNILETLERHSYDGFLTVELYTYPHQPEEAARKSYLYLKRLVDSMEDLIDG